MTPDRWSDHAFVVPVYGDSPFLADCLRSLKAQDLASEVLLTTSTPSVGLARTADAFGCRLVVNPERHGIGADWNFALAQTDRRYVTLAHQDDVYAQGFLSAGRRLFARHPGCGLCFTGYQEIDDAGRATRSKISRVKHLLALVVLGRRERVSGRRLRRFLSLGNPLPCSSVTFDRAKLTGALFSETLASNLDWAAWLALCDAGETFLYDRRRLVGRRHNPLTETSRLIRAGQRQREDEAMFAQLWPRRVARTIAYIYRAGY